MGSKKKLPFIAVIFLFSLNGAKAQSDFDFTLSLGYRAYFAKTSLLNSRDHYSLNYHAHAPGYYTSFNVTTKNFFLRPSFSKYGIIHSHGVFNPTTFAHDSPKNKNIRNTNSIRELNLDFGYEFEVYLVTLRIYAGGGLISTIDQEWKTRNRTVAMLYSIERKEVFTSLEILSESFVQHSYTSNMGFGFYMPIYSNLVCELDICYQNHFTALAVNAGSYSTMTDKGSGFGGRFSSVLTGAWIIQFGVGYTFN